MSPVPSTFSTHLMNRLLLAPLSFIAFTSSSLLHAEEWSRFRGPNGSGVGDAKNLPATFDGSNTAWQVPMQKGWSSPVIWKDRLFVTAETDGGHRAVLCLSAKDGSTLWKHEETFLAHQQHKFNSFASSSPYVDDKGIYINWTTGDSVSALALDHNGKLIWHRENLSPYVHEHGSGCSSIVADGVMLVRAEFSLEKNGKSLATPEQVGWTSSVQGLDTATGKTLWKVDLPNTINPYSTPIVRATSGGAHEFIFANTTSGLMGVDAKTGKVNWQHNPGFKQRSVGSFVFANDILFAAFGSGDGGKESALIKLAGGKAQEVGSILKNIPYVPTPLVIGNRLYMLKDGGILTCLKWPSGEEVYSERVVGGSGGSTKYFASPVAADGKIFCCSQTGEVVVVKAGDKFEILAANKLDSPINATPAIGHNRIYVRTQDSLFAVGAKSVVLP